MVREVNGSGAVTDADLGSADFFLAPLNPRLYSCITFTGCPPLATDSSIAKQIAIDL
jgi:hypothetical protein